MTPEQHPPTITIRRSILDERETLSEHAIFEVETGECRIEVTVSNYKNGRLVIRRVGKRGNSELTIYPNVSNQIEVKI